MDYSRFDVYEFASDEYFINWVKNPTPESQAFWVAWLSKHPHQAEVFKTARQIVLAIEIRPRLVDENDFIEGWANISKHIYTGRFGDSHEQPITTNIKKFSWQYKIAVSLAFFILSTFCVVYYAYRAIEINTAYGESRTLFLPDSSKVTLNGNSSIRYRPFHFNSGEREVRLKGEAFFSVIHQKNHNKFFVRTNEAAVEVLGTKFNVNSRHGNTRVVLQEGKVRLHTSNKEIIMNPGGLVDVSPKIQTPSQVKVDPDEYLAWKNNRLIFNATSLEEIASLLEDTFGYTVIFKDDAIKERLFSGSASTDDVNGLLANLSEIFDLTIEQQGKTLFIMYSKDKPGQSSSP